jgi:hypothetical protein
MNKKKVNFNEIFSQVRKESIFSIYEEKVISLEEKNRQLKNKIEHYETILHTIQMHREITMNREKLVKLLELISAWSYAHRVGNGELYEDEIQKNVDRAFKNIMNFVTGKN